VTLKLKYDVMGRSEPGRGHTEIKGSTHANIGKPKPIAEEDHGLSTDHRKGKLAGVSQPDWLI
jgi:hypothetical protein